MHQHLSISASQSASKRGSESQRSKCSKSKASKLFCLPLGGACENTEVMAAGKSNGEALGDFSADVTRSSDCGNANSESPSHAVRLYWPYTGRLRHRSKQG